MVFLPKSSVFLFALLGICSALSGQSSGGEKLYNGIVLPSDWPPRRLPTQEVQVPPYLTNPPAIIPIDVGRQLFVDDFLIAQTSSLTRTFHRPTIVADPVLHTQDLDFEASPYSDGVWFDPATGKYKLYYWGGQGNVVAYADSPDGITWNKPLFPDTTPIANTNDVIWNSGRDSSTIWMDLEERDPSKRFKAFVYTGGARQSVYFSADGIHWVLQFTLNSYSDRTTFFWNPFRRVWVESARDGAFLPAAPTRPATSMRIRTYTESRDLALWNPTNAGDSFWAAADEQDPPYSGNQAPFPELYNLDAVGYESLMVGLFSMYYPENPDLVELNVGFSRDGFNWLRPTRGAGSNAFIPASNISGNWNGFNTQSAGGGFLVVGDELWFYFSARNTPHSIIPTQFSTGLAKMRRDGFASMDAGAAEGTLTTRPITFQGNRLFVNVNNPAGTMHVDVLDSSGQIVATSQAVSTNSTHQELQFGGAGLQALAGQTVRFKFSLTNGELYSFWVSSSPSGSSNGFVAAGGPGFSAPVDVVGSGATGGADTRAPLRLLGSPGGNLPAGTTHVDIALMTDESATCKYSTTPGVSYGAMTLAMTPTSGGVIHGATVTSLAADSTYSFYVRCMDAAGNQNQTDFVISFTVSKVDLANIVAAQGDVTGGFTVANNTIALSAPDYQQDVVVSLSSSNPAALSVPSSITISAGSLSGSFTITTSPVAIVTPVTLTATLGAEVRLAVVNVRPNEVDSITLDSLTGFSGQFFDARIAITDVAPAGGALVLLSSSNPLVLSVPASVTILAGGMVSPHTTLSALTVSVATSVDFFASYGGRTIHKTLTVKPRPVLNSIAVAAATTPGGTSVTGNNVLLTDIALGDTTVQLSSSDPTAASVPASIIVPDGQTQSPNFTITTFPVTVDKLVTLTATSGNVTKTAQLTVLGVPVPSSVHLSPSTVYGGTVTTLNTVGLTSNALAGGALVALSSSDQNLATVPPNVLVPAGQNTSAAFNITTLAVATDSTVTISASLAGVSATGNLLVKKLPVPVSVNLGATSVYGGSPTTGNQVQLDLAPSAGTVTLVLSSSNPAIASVPASIVVPEGTVFSPAFAVSTNSVSSDTDVIISAISGGVTKTATLTVKAIPTLSGLTLTAASMDVGSSTTTNQILLTAPAPPGGLTVALSSSNPSAAAVPATVQVAQGSASGGFVVTTGTVVQNTAVVITATLNAATRTANLTVTVPASAFSLTAVQSATDPTSFTVTWAAPSGRPAGDWIGMFLTGAPNANYLAYRFTNGTQAGSTAFTAPGPGQYEFRYMLNNSLTDITRSAIFTVASTQTLPTISAVQSANLTASSVMITWNSNVPTDSEVEYGTSTGYGSLYTDAVLVTAHSALLTGLASTTQYHFRVKAKDSSGNVGVSGDSVFTTLAEALAYSLTAVPALVNAGGSITVNWTAPAGRPSSDWIGLFAAGASNSSYLAFQYTGGTTSGSRIFVAPAQTGQYEFRYLLNNGFTDVARSSAVTVGTSVVLPVISAVQSSNVTTSTASITWASNVPTDSQVEYGTGTGYGSSTVLDTAKLTTHTVPLTGLTPATQYHFRVKGTDALGNPTVSGDYTLTTLTASQDYTLTASPVSVSPGGTITASWTAPAGRPTVDWIGLFASGASNTSYLAYKFTGGATSGSGTFVAPLQAGQYEFRYLLNNGFTDVVRSSAVTVGSGVVLPVNSAIQSSNITAGSATITWTSNVAIDSQVEYGLTSAYGLQSTLDPAKVTAHTVQLTGLTSATQYHFRVKGTDGSGNAAVSGDFTFTTLLTSQTYTLTATPPSVNPGSPLSLSWTAPAGRPSTDWLGLFAKGAANTVTPLWWQYTNGSSSGTVNVTAPSLGGQYEFRYFQQNGYTLAVTSNTVTVVVPTNYSVTGTPSTITAGGTLTVSWAAPAGRPGTDWVGLFNVGAANTSYLWYRYTGGTTGGSTPVTAPSQPGQYEFRYLLNGGFTDAARSAPISVQ